MIRFTLVRPGPRRLVLDKPQRTLQVQLQRRVLQLTFHRSTTVVVSGDQPLPPAPSAQQWATLNW